MGYSVRPAVVDDAAGIAVAHVASWRAAYRGLLPDELLDNLSVAQRQRRWSAMLSAPAARSETLVATQARTVVGFASVGPRRYDTRAATPAGARADTPAGAPATPADTPAADEGELYAVYLSPDHWGRGVGHRLHQVALTRLREHGFSTATLWVLHGNERAIDFYLRAGWRENGVTRVDTRPDGTLLPETQLHRRLG